MHRNVQKIHSLENGRFPKIKICYKNLRKGYCHRPHQFVLQSDTILSLFIAITICTIITLDNQRRLRWLSHAFTIDQVNWMANISNAQSPYIFGLCVCNKTFTLKCHCDCLQHPKCVSMKSGFGICDFSFWAKIS